MLLGGLLGPKLPSMQHAMMAHADEAGVDAARPDVRRTGETVAMDHTLAVAQSQMLAQPRLQQSRSMPPEGDGMVVPWHQVRDLIREEMSSLRPAASQPVQPMQLIINNHAEAKADQQTTSGPDQPQSEFEGVTEAVTSFFQSPMNRLCLFSVVGLGLYMLQGHLQHKWRMAEVQRRIDANLFLRFTQILMPSSR
mmetsp:Transcript_78812/g.219085  ORF Transcript_78812/g.219085 Transcript_78812/m.219085 type:complete len:195 (-) Transcript_78812:113-697(-)